MNSPETEKAPQDKQTSKVAKILTTTTLQAGFTIMNTQPTHKTSTIDHIITTSPARMQNITTTNTHMIDHHMVTGNRIKQNLLEDPDMSYQDHTRTDHGTR